MIFFPIVYFQHLIDREPAAYGDDTVVFDELLHKLSESVERFKTLYDSRKAMIGLLLSYEHGSAKWDEARITLRMMTGELKDIAEEINMVTYQMALLRDKKQEARLTDKEEGTL